MNHAISNAGSLEAGLYRAIDADEAFRLNQERIQITADKIIEAFDAKDAMSALDLVAQRSPQYIDRFHNELTKLVSMDLNKVPLELEPLYMAFRAIAHYYAGYRAQSETPL
ncbi:hypothetical protein [Pseudomonas sp.]|uniref:hypothetical protein n=1 Tax=Pseudomonas sp. TaxID=306 RepID=UPI00257B12AA|nr:hypothetical protein [Pseudomonas sp.]